MLKPEINIRDREKGKEKEKERDEGRFSPGEGLAVSEDSRLKFKVRFDYRGNPRPARFFFGGKKTEEAAHETREQQVALWRNIPLQGISVDQIDLGETYFIYDGEVDEDIAFAPLELLVYAESLEDLLRFIMREEFRRIEILEPPLITMKNREAERLLFKINEFLQSQITRKLRENSRQ